MSKKNTNTAPEVVATSVVATATAGNTVATPKTTKWEQLAKCHVDLCRNDLGEVKISCPEFRDLAAGQRYEFKCKCTGKTWHIHITEKISDYDAGGHTVISGTLNGEKFTNLNITQLKERVECEYRREKDGSSNCKTALGKAKFATDKLAEVIAACNDEELTKAYQQLKGLVGLKRAEEQKREAEEREQRDRAERAKKKSERADSHADDMTDGALIAQVAKRRGISHAEAKKMLGL